MYLLACETSTLLGSVTVLKNDQVLSTTHRMRQGSHSDFLNLMIDQCLSEARLSLADIDFFVTGHGPGSFTGIRISFNTIKTFSSIFCKKMAVVNSLVNLAFKNRDLAFEYSDHQEPLEICCAINAFKNMLYLGLYKIDTSKSKDSFNLIEIKTPEVVRVQNLSKHINSLFPNKRFLCIGDGFENYSDFLKSSGHDFIIRPNLNAPIEKNLIPDFDFPDATVSGKLAYYINDFKSWSEETPLYLRASEAEENLTGILYQPLNE